MKKLALALSLIFLFSHNASAKEYSSLEISERIFPETKSWQSVASLPAVDKAILIKILPSLRSAYMESDLEQNPFSEKHHLEGKDCTFFESVTDEETGNIKGFHYLDVNKDGIKDVIYTGTMICGEGDLTMTFLGKKGFGMPTFSLYQKSVLPVTALKVLPGANDMDVSSVSNGCCGSREDIYYKTGYGQAINPYYGEKVYSSTIWPNIYAEKIQKFLVTKETPLRSSPERHDEYSKDDSGFYSHAVFGNILRRYLAKSDGTVLARQNDKQGNTWLFVSFSLPSDLLMLDDPISTRYGWINAADIKISD